MVTPALDAWPEDGLEGQPACPFCGEAQCDVACRRGRLRIKVLEWMPPMRQRVNDEVVVMAQDVLPR
jgi:hypothetical protein